MDTSITEHQRAEEALPAGRAVLQSLSFQPEYNALVRNASLYDGRYGQINVV
ncbi:MAG: hypothetical protein ABFC94_18710 [Syntrophomonas sp.]